MSERGLYEIQVEGWIGERWASWFDGMPLTFEHDQDGAPITTLTATVADQAALRGILARIWDLNLSVRSVTRSEPKGAESNE